jgi:hypothetical protein
MDCLESCFGEDGRLIKPKVILSDSFGLNAELKQSVYTRLGNRKDIQFCNTTLDRLEDAAYSAAAAKNFASRNYVVVDLNRFDKQELEQGTKLHNFCLKHRIPLVVYFDADDDLNPLVDRFEDSGGFLGILPSAQFIEKYPMSELVLVNPEESERIGVFRDYSGQFFKEVRDVSINYAVHIAFDAKQLIRARQEGVSSSISQPFDVSAKLKKVRGIERIGSY